MKRPRPSSLDSRPSSLRSPFPWFGGKRRAAHIVWPRLGHVPNLVVPFCGSLAVELNCPWIIRTETFNDKDCYLANFWRAVQFAPEAVAYWADWPVNEADLHARHRWLVAQTLFRHRLLTDPHYFDAKIAGWWVWGICQWIGSGWCSRPEWTGRHPSTVKRGINTDAYQQRPALNSEHGIRRRDIQNSSAWTKRPVLGRGGRGVNSRRGQWQSRPHLSNVGGQGVIAISDVDHRLPQIRGGNRGLRVVTKMPVMKRNNGSGILRKDLSQQLPVLGGDGSGSSRGVLSLRRSTMDFRHSPLVEYMFALRDRLRHARVVCGDWRRVLGPSPTHKIGRTAVFLDPPYGHDAGRDPSIYNAEDPDVAAEVAEWARENGHHPLLRIALCGYEGEHKMPKNWTCVPWKANGGYGNQAQGPGRKNAGRERIWFSPHCLKP